MQYKDFLHKVCPKDTFLSLMQCVEEEHQSAETLTRTFQNLRMDVHLSPGKCADGILNLLQDLFHDNDNWIDYFVFWLGFGKYYRQDLVSSGEIPAKLQTAEDLYELLIERLEVEEVGCTGTR